MKIELNSNMAVVLVVLLVGIVVCFGTWQTSSCVRANADGVQVCVQACIDKGKDPGACRKACTGSKDDSTSHPKAVNVCIKNCFRENNKPLECKQACTAGVTPGVKPVVQPKPVAEPKGVWGSTPTPSSANDK